MREEEGEEAVVRRQRQGCSRMRQDLITPYNVLFCGCLAYTPVPVCRLGNTVNTPMALPPPSSHLLLCLLSHSLLSIFSSLLRSFSSLSSSKCGWFVYTCHKACLQPLPPGRSTSHPPSGACVLLYALLYESHTFAKGIRELILI